MFHKAVDLSFKQGTVLQLTFSDGKVKQYDMAVMFEKFPQLKQLEDRKLFLSGKLEGSYGIVWNDELDIEAETIYEDGITVANVEPANEVLSRAISSARAKAGMTQQQVAKLAGIDQSDFSKIERGMANPSLNTLSKIAKAMGCSLSISIN